MMEYSPYMDDREFARYLREQRRREKIVLFLGVPFIVVMWCVIVLGLFAM